MKKLASVSALALVLTATGCYNNPHLATRAPGEGGRAGDTSRGPTTGPGTTPGGSTAGPQPAAKPEASHAAEPAKQH